MSSHDVHVFTDGQHGKNPLPCARSYDPGSQRSCVKGSTLSRQTIFMENPSQQTKHSSGETHVFAKDGRLPKAFVPLPHVFVPSRRYTDPDNGPLMVRT